MKKYIKHWWDTIPHHSHPHYFSVVTFPAWAILFFVSAAPLIGIYLYSPSNPHLEALQNINSTFN